VEAEADGAVAGQRRGEDAEDEREHDGEEEDRAFVLGALPPSCVRTLASSQVTVNAGVVGVDRRAADGRRRQDLDLLVAVLHFAAPSWIRPGIEYVHVPELAE
jgi:hypothetical protein